MLQLLRYEKELIKSHDIRTTSETNHASACTPAEPSNDMNNPILALNEFNNEEQE